MDSFLKKIPYMTLIIFSVIMLLTPFKPMPHVLEKILMLKDGALHRPMDIFDLFFHCAPSLLLAAKFIRERKS
jgi:hypothetical protein